MNLNAERFACEVCPVDRQPESGRAKVTASCNAIWRVQFGRYNLASNKYARNPKDLYRAALIVTDPQGRLCPSLSDHDTAKLCALSNKRWPISSDKSKFQLIERCLPHDFTYLASYEVQFKVQLQDSSGMSKNNLELATRTSSLETVYSVNYSLAYRLNFRLKSLLKSPFIQQSIHSKQESGQFYLIWRTRIVQFKKRLKAS